MFVHMRAAPLRRITNICHWVYSYYCIQVTFSSVAWNRHVELYDCCICVCIVTGVVRCGDPDLLLPLSLYGRYGGHVQLQQVQQQLLPRLFDRRLYQLWHEYIRGFRHLLHSRLHCAREGGQCGGSRNWWFVTFIWIVFLLFLTMGIYFVCLKMF